MKTGLIKSTAVALAMVSFSQAASANLERGSVHAQKLLSGNDLILLDLFCFSSQYGIYCVGGTLDSEDLGATMDIPKASNEYLKYLFRGLMKRLDQ